MIRKSHFLALFVLLAILVSVGGATAEPNALMMTTALKNTITHQGHLEKNSSPFTGTCDMQFKLFDALSGGGQIGSTQAKTGVAVNNGLFTVQLDFGPTAFSGSDRYLETAVDCNDGSFTTLSPRQALTSSPYASHATSAEQLVKEFVVAPGENISAGDLVSLINNGQVRKGTGLGAAAVFNSADTAFVSAVALSPNRFVVVYSDVANSGFGTAVVGTVTGNTITFGPETVFNTRNSVYLSAAALSSSQFVVAYPDSGLGTAIIGTISGDTITFGSATIFTAGSADTYDLQVAALSPDQFVVAYQDTSNFYFGTAVVGTVSGDTIGFGPETIINAAGDDSLRPVALSPTQFVVVYRDLDIGATAVVGTVSGNTITFGPPSDVGYIDALSVAAIAPTQFVVAYVANKEIGTAVIGTVSGNIISFGPENIFSTVPNFDVHANPIALLTLSPAQFLVAYADTASASYATRIGMTTGNVISFSPEVAFVELGASFADLSPSQFVIAYRDGSTGFGGAIVGSANTGPLVGTAKSAASGGDSLPVIIGGVSDVHSGLSPGAVYYAQPDGTLTTTFTRNLVGLAISPTEILLKAGGK